MSEINYSNSVENKIKETFHIYKEVWGTHFSGKRLRIDAILVPKDTSGWKNKNIALGIEYKDDKRIKGDMTNYTKCAAQCVDYANTKWDGFGYIYVFASPGFNAYNGDKYFNFVFPRILSSLGVGEFKKHEHYGWSFWFQKDDRIWSEKNGVERGSHWNMIRKFGSR